MTRQCGRRALVAAGVGRCEPPAREPPGGRVFEARPRWVSDEAAEIRHWGRLVMGALYPLRQAIRMRPHRKNLHLERQEKFRRLHLTPAELDGACAAAGLEKANARHYNVQPACRPATLVAPRLCHLVNRPFEGLARAPGGKLLATGYIGLYRRV